MHLCPVCGQNNQILLCDKCGFDASSDYEHFPTLLSAIPTSCSIAGYRAEREQRTKNVLRCLHCGGHGFSLDFSNKTFICMRCQRHMTEEDVLQQYRSYTIRAEELARAQEAEQTSMQESQIQGHELYLEGLKWYYGTDVPKDYKKAVHCFRESAECKKPHGQFWLAYCYFCGLGLPRDYAQAVNFFFESAGRGYAPAQYWLGECFYYGHGVQKDNKVACSHYQQAADQQFAAAQCALGVCYYYGRGVRLDHRKAVEYFDGAAKQNDPQGQYWLGRCLYYGHGVQQDYEMAAALFKKATEQGHDKARINLGECYQYGRGVESDIVKAADQYRLAKKRKIPGGESAYRALLENASRSDRMLLKRFGHE